MEIRLEPHTLERAVERGASKDEIIETLAKGEVVGAKAGRNAKALVFDFNKERGGKKYEQKKIEVYYTIENNVIITITVYVFYGEFIEEK